MALFKSQVLTQASGSVGGMTYTRTPSGMVIRGRSMPVNPNTARQQEMRVAMSTLSTYWVQTLTEDQRLAWSDYASQVGRKNKLGDQIFLSGISMFIRCNSPRIQAKELIIADAPVEYTCGEPVIEGVISQASATPFAVSFGFNASGLDIADLVLIYVSKPTNPSINYFRGPYRFAITGNTVANPVVLPPTDGWVAGNKIHVRAQVTYADGRLSPSTRYQFVLKGTPA